MISDKHDNGAVKVLLHTVTGVCLALAALLFPFSVAASNALLGVTLVFGVVSGLWCQGLCDVWGNYKRLSIATVAYLGLLILGLAWSQDIQWGLHVLGRHWFWLLLPVVVALSRESRWKYIFLLSLSAGLTLNLAYCVLQMFGYVEPTTDGSSAVDATGHIGHIGFGFVYGIWAAWLLHLGLLWRGWKRYLAWVLAGWSYVMVFSAQGRSGYLIAAVLVVLVFVKWLYDTKSWYVAMPVAAICSLIILAMLMGPGKARLQGTWLAFTQTQDGAHLDQQDSSDNAILATDERFQMWKSSIAIWQQYPVRGVGTGGLPYAVSELKKNGLSSVHFSFSHPHNQYLLDLIRWGPAGFLLLCYLLLVWGREGLSVPWPNSLTAPLFSLSALALALHALSSASMEEHFSGVLAVLLLGVAMSGSDWERSNERPESTN